MISIRSTAAPTRFEAIEMLGSTARFEQHRTGFPVPASMLALPVAKRTGTPSPSAVEVRGEGNGVAYREASDKQPCAMCTSSCGKAMTTPASLSAHQIASLSSDRSRPATQGASIHTRTRKITDESPKSSN